MKIVLALSDRQALHLYRICRTLKGESFCSEQDKEDFLEITANIISKNLIPEICSYFEKVKEVYMEFIDLPQKIKDYYPTQNMIKGIRIYNGRQQSYHIMLRNGLKQKWVFMNNEWTLACYAKPNTGRKK